MSKIARPHTEAGRIQLSQIATVGAGFDEPNLIASAGLVPVMRLARQAGLEQLVARMVSVPGGAGFDAAAKVAPIVAGMITGTDSIDDLDVLCEGAVHRVLPGVKAPSTLGTFCGHSPSVTSGSWMRSPVAC